MSSLLYLANILMRVRFSYVQLAYLLLPVIFIVFMVMLWKGRKLPVFRFKLSLNHECLRVITCAVIAAISLGSVLSLAWVQHDDWHFISLQTIALPIRVHLALERYLLGVSRMPDVFLYFTGMSPCAWEKVIITPLVAALVPFSIFRLVKRTDSKIGNARGVAFYIFVFCLCLVGVCTEPWRNYWCWAAVVNYLVVATYTVWFLSFYRLEQLNVPDSVASMLGMFVLGIAAGWGNECVSVILVPGLACYAVCSAVLRIKWNLSRYAGGLGALFGAVLLFASPALMMRRENMRNALLERCSYFSTEWINDFLSDLSWEKMSIIEIGKQYYLYDFPFVSKLHFIPFFIEYYWSCCMIGCIAFTTLAVLLASKGKQYFKTVGFAMLFIVVSWVMAASYMQSVFPQKMSYLFPCFLIIAGAAYLFLRLDTRTWILYLLSTVMLATTFFILGPSTVEAYRYKKYEAMRFADIADMKAKGKLDVVLPFHPDKMPRNKTCMIGYSWYDLSPNAHGYPNDTVAKLMGVRSIRQSLPSQDVGERKEKSPLGKGE